MPIVADSVDETLRQLRECLAGVVPDFELAAKAELIFAINRLKAERGAVILGHNYMEPALFHGVPDFVGDSLELSRRAAETSGDPIVFCGVRFMAETAKILNPERTVLLPAPVGGCSLAAAITAADVRGLKRRHPGAPVVSYVNTYADVKAESDIICTSGNASAVVESLDAETVIFTPDEFLAANVARETGRRLVFSTAAAPGRAQPTSAGARTLVAWRGRCEVHEKFTVDDVARVRAQFPDVVILAHPECRPEVVAAADFAGGTAGMIRYVRDSGARRFLLLTECSMADNIAAENKRVEMLRLCSVRCPHMNEVTLGDTLNALRFNRYVITVPEGVGRRARRALDRMFAVSAPAGR